MEEILKKEETGDAPEEMGGASGEVIDCATDELTPEEALNAELVEHDTQSLVAVTAETPGAMRLPVPQEAFQPPPGLPSPSVTLALAQHEMDWLMELAQLAAQSGMYPGQKPSELMMKAMLGLTIGLKPAQAFQCIDVIRGRPAFGAELQRSLLERWGLRIVQRRLGDAWNPEDDQKFCILQLVRAATGEVLGEASFTIQEAQKAGLMRSDAWQKWTSDMLFARASTRLISRFAPWVLFQLPEDLEKQS